MVMTLDTSDAERRVVLGVKKSLSARVWRERLDDQGLSQALAIAQRTELPEVVGRVLAGRNVLLEEASGFLNPSIKDLMPDPSKLVDMDKACARVADAVQAGVKIAVFGDYDVDGATSSALLKRYLVQLGAEPDVYIPDRIIDGYGPNPTAINQLHAGGARLLVTVDCAQPRLKRLTRPSASGLRWWFWITIRWMRSSLKFMRW